MQNPANVVALRKILAQCYPSSNQKNERNAVLAFLTSKYYFEDDLPKLESQMASPSPSDNLKSLRVVLFTNLLARFDTLHDFCDYKRTKQPELKRFIIDLIFQDGYKDLMRQFLLSIPMTYQAQNQIMSLYLTLCNYGSGSFATFEHAVIGFVRLVRVHVFNSQISEIANVVISNNHNYTEFFNHMSNNLGLNNGKKLDIVYETSHLSLTTFCDKSKNIEVVNSVASLYDKLGTTNHCDTQKYVCNDIDLQRALGQSLQIKSFSGQNSPACGKDNLIKYKLFYENGRLTTFDANRLQSSFGVKLYGNLVWSLAQKRNFPYHQANDMNTFVSVFGISGESGQDEGKQIETKCMQIFDIKRNGDWGIVEIARILQRSQTGHDDQSTLMTLDGPCYAKSLLTTTDDNGFGLTSIQTQHKDDQYILKIHKGGLNEYMRREMNSELTKWHTPYKSPYPFALSDTEASDIRSYVLSILLVVEKYSKYLHEHDRNDSSYPTMKFYYEVINNLLLKLMMFVNWLFDFIAPRSTIHADFVTLMSKKTDVINNDDVLLKLNSELHQFMEHHVLDDKAIQKFFFIVYGKTMESLSTDLTQFMRILAPDNPGDSLMNNLFNICNERDNSRIENLLNRLEDSSLPLGSFVFQALSNISKSKNWYDTNKNEKIPIQPARNKCDKTFQFPNANENFASYVEARNNIESENITSLSTIIRYNANQTDFPKKRQRGTESDYHTFQKIRSIIKEKSTDLRNLCSKIPPAKARRPAPTPGPVPAPAPTAPTGPSPPADAPGPSRRDRPLDRFEPYPAPPPKRPPGSIIEPEGLVVPQRVVPQHVVPQLVVPTKASSNERQSKKPKLEGGQRIHFDDTSTLAMDIVTLFNNLPNEMSNYVLVTFIKKDEYSFEKINDKVQTVYSTLWSYVNQLSIIEKQSGFIEIPWHQVELDNEFLKSNIVGRDKKGEFVFIHKVQFCINMYLYQTSMQQILSSTLQSLTSPTRVSQNPVIFENPSQSVANRPMPPRQSRRPNKDIIVTPPANLDVIPPETEPQIMEAPAGRSERPAKASRKLNYSP